MRTAAGVLIVAILSAPAAVGGQGTAIQGVVRSSNGLGPVAYANIEVLDREISGWTDDRGVYSIGDLPRGTWRLRVVHPGHDPLQIDIRVPGNRPLALDLTLRARPGASAEALADFEPFTIDHTLPALLNREEVRLMIQSRYPPEFTSTGRGGETVLRLWLDERGQVVRNELSRSSGHPTLDSIAGQVATKMRFRPAKNRDEPVRVIVLIPVVFSVPPQADIGA